MKQMKKTGELCVHFFYLIVFISYTKICQKQVDNVSIVAIWLFNNNLYA